MCLLCSRALLKNFLLTVCVEVALIDRDSAFKIGGINVARAVSVQRGFVRRDVMLEVSELEIKVEHLAVVAACCNLTVHLSSLLRFFRVLALHRPLSTAHLHVHVECKHVHKKVEQVDDHYCQEHHEEIIRFASIPVKYSLFE